MLRQAMVHNQLDIDGIKSPPLSVLPGQIGSRVTASPAVRPPGMQAAFPTQSMVG